MPMLQTAPPPGARALIRDEEWLIEYAEPGTLGGWQLVCTGVSETVRNRRALFLSPLEHVKLLDPAATRFVADETPAFAAARLCIEARLRQSAAAGEALVIGPRAAMDTLAFQYVPAHRALAQLRPRLLIADTVGLGKTLAAGILSAELMRRGRARRILVVTTKSMIRQFQQEFWNRFTIALTRLDSAGIQRIRRQIPASHNPFHYYERTIISVDTLKRDSEYRHHLEQAHWDLILIDEAHNVSFKGSRHLGNRLATLLAQRSDALILLTATPHNGRKESFASLMRMLDPTALPENADYGRADVEHLFVRRFKRDVQQQIRAEFPERQVHRLRHAASAAENAAHAALAALRLASDAGGPREGAMLFRTTLEKALFSSPAACLQTIRERLNRLQAREPSHPDLAPLRSLRQSVEAIGVEGFSKFAHLLRLLRDDGPWHWDGRDAGDRLVLFTERIETLKFLREHLPPALGLPDEAVAILHGQLPDVQIQETVDAFGRRHAPLRLLIASDVASEGLNLHHCAHRLLHFDVPWSLMVFQQRNGRVDRYGQRHAPQIGYLLTEAALDTVRGDLRVIEVLIDKDEQAARNIGDPSAFLGEYDADAEVARVASAIEQHQPAAEFAAQLDDPDADPFERLFGASASEPPAAPPPCAAVDAPVATLPTLFADDYAYAEAALAQLQARQPGQVVGLAAEAASRTLSFQPGVDLAALLGRELADEMWPRDNTLRLCADRARIDAAIRSARETDAWPQLQYLWPLHPVAQWLDFRMLALFGRQCAPVLRVARGLAAGEALVLVLGQVSNRRGQARFCHWLGIRLDGARQAQAALSLDEVLQLTGLGSAEVANDGRLPELQPFQNALPDVIRFAEQRLRTLRQPFDADCRQRLQRERERLQTLRGRHQQQLELDFSGADARSAGLRQRRAHDTQALFKDHDDWAKNTLELDDRIQLTVVALLLPASAR